jgi:WD40 repeat protein
VAALLGLVVLVAAVGSAGVLWQFRRAEQRRGEAEQHRARAEQQRGRAEGLRAQAEEQRERAEALAAGSVLEQGRALAERGEVAHGLPRIAQALTLAPPGNAPLQHAIRSNLAAWSGRLNPLRAMFRFAVKEFRVAQVLPGAQPTWCRYSPDGRTLLIIAPYMGRTTGVADASIRLWSTADGAPVGQEMTSGLNEIFVPSPDAKFVLIASLGTSLRPDRTARLWTTAESAPVGPAMSHDSSVTAAAFSPDGRIVATGCVSGKVRLWSTTDAAPIGAAWEAIAEPPKPLQLHAFRTIALMLFSPDGRILLVGGDMSRGRIQGIARLFRVPAGTPIGDPVPLSDPHPTAVFSPDGQTVLIQEGSDQSARVGLWRTADGAPIHPAMIRPSARGRRVRDLAISPKGSIVLRILGREIGPISIDQYRDLERKNAVELRTVAQLWDVAAGHAIGPLLIHPTDITSAVFSPDGLTVLTAADDGSVRLWNSADGTAIGPGLPHRGTIWFYHQGTIPNPALADRIVTRPGEKPGVGAYGVVAQAIRAMTMSPDGKIVLTASNDGAVRLWDVARLRDAAAPTLIGPPVEYDTPGEGGITRAWFSPDSWTFWVANQGSHRLHLWKVPDEDSLRWPLIREDRSNPEVFLPGGQEIYIPRSGTGTVPETIRAPARLWEVHEKWSQHARDFSLLHPGGRVLLGVRGQSAGSSLSMEAAQELLGQPPAGWSVAHRGRIRAASFSPDGRTLLTGGEDHLARLWSTVDGRATGKGMWHQGPVTSVAFSPDGRTALTGSEDRTARLWSAGDGTPIGPALVHPGPGRVVGFSPDGRDVLTGADDKITRTWRAPAPIAGDPRRINLWVELITGMEVDEFYEIRLLDAETWQERRQLLSGLGGPPPHGL